MDREEVAMVTERLVGLDGGPADIFRDPTGKGPRDSQACPACGGNWAYIIGWRANREGKLLDDKGQPIARDREGRLLAKPAQQVTVQCGQCGREENGPLQAEHDRQAAEA
jgi:hypothetical protein